MKITYSQFNQAIDLITTEVLKSSIQYQYICGIVRGGLVPATVLSYKLNLPLITLNCSMRDYTSFDNDAKTIDTIRNKNVLLVDDIIDSGATIKRIKTEIRHNVHVAALIYNKNQQLTGCQYYYKVIDRSVDDQWIDFWWDGGVDEQQVN